MVNKWSPDIGDLLLQLGENLDREGLQETPDRVLRAWHELLIGYTLEPSSMLSTTFESEGDGLQACTHIEFTSMCEHHLLPFIGYVNIVYRPSAKVVGLSKLARLVDCFARRLQIQERMTIQIAETLTAAMNTKGVLVNVVAKHLCCHGRGVRRSLMEFKTVATTGEVTPDFWEAIKC